MPRNNADRLGSGGEEESPKQEVQKNPQNEPLSFVVPTEVVDLPSGGRFYTEESSLYGKDSVEIRYMTTKDEDILNNKSLLKKGLALDRMLQGLLVDGSININDMLIGDKNALVVAARVTGFGGDYETNVTCLNCLASTKNKFNLSEVKSKDFEDAAFNEDNTFSILLPQAKCSVQVRLLTGKDEQNIREMSEKRKKYIKDPGDTPTSDFLRNIIVSVNDNKDRDTINMLVNNMLTRDSKVLKDEYNKAVPDVNLAQMFECPECGSEREVSIPFSVEFFWPE